MGTNGGTCLYSENNKRVSHTFSQETTTSASRCDWKQPGCARVSSNDISNKQNEKSRSSGTCCSLSKFCVTNVSCSQKRRLCTSNFQPEGTEPVHNNRSFQTNKCTSHTRFFTTTRLAEQNRSLTGLLPPTSGSQPQKVPASRLLQGTTRNDLFTFRPEHKPKDLCNSHELGSPITQTKRYQNSCLFRRFLNSKSKHKYTTQPCQYCDRDFRGIRLVDKLQKIYSKSVKQPSILGNPLGSLDQPHGSSRRESTCSYRQNRSVTEEEVCNNERATKPGRAPQFCQLCSTKRQAQLSCSFEPTEPLVRLRPEKVAFHTSRSNRKSDMVASKLQVFISNTQAASDSFSHDRCIRYSVGSSIERLVSDGTVVRNRKESSLQSKRDVSNPKSFARSFSAPESQYCVDSKRQQISYCISPSRRRNQICSSNGLDIQRFQNSRRSSDPCKRFPHSGYLQQSRRSPVETARSSRMASFSGMHSKSIFEVGNTINRSVCFQPSSRGVQLRIPGSNRQSGVAPRCLFPEVELQSGMGISTPVLDTQGFESPKSRLGNVPVDRSTLGTSVLAPRHQMSGLSGTIYPSPPGQSPNRYRDRTSPSECPRNDSGGMEMWGWSGLLKAWDSNQLSLLEESWRPSTRKVYYVAWRRWSAWCETHDINPTTPSGSDLARFLSDLYLKHNLAYNTILLYKSVVSTLCNPEISGQLSSHVLVKHILKSISLRKPVAHTKSPVWNIDELASYLENYSIDKNNILHVQRHTAALLLLCSGRRIHDLTLLSVDPDNCFLHQANSLVLWPRFGSKTDSAKYRQSGWRLYANPGKERLDPVFWVKHTISLLENRRNKSNSKNLLVNVRGQPRPASRTLIAGWIKSLLTGVGIKATPGSIRSAVASKNWLDNYPIEEILARGNWRSQNTFCKYYKREISTANNNSSSVTMLFNPVD